MAPNMDPWHYPRTELAERHIGVLTGGLANALVMFGRRRTGKTEFLLHDLAPAAERVQRIVVYVNFWASPLAPATVLTRALERALKGGPLSARLAEAAKRVTPKLKLSGGVGGLEGEAALELGNVGAAPASDALLHIDDLMGKLVSGKRRALVLLDEVQELAPDAKNAALIAALRTSLDTRKDKVAAVFTGSSRDGLNAMFARRAAPFFQFATPIELPPLSEPFVDHLLATFARVTGETLNRKIVLEAFEAGHRSPFFLRKLLELVALDPERDVVHGAQTLRARLAADLGYDRIWLTLAPLQRALLAHLALGGAGPFSEASRKQIGNALGGSVPSAAQLQSALRRLIRLKVIVRLDGRSDYALDDPEFGTWVAANLKA